MNWQGDAMLSLAAMPWIKKLFYVTVGAISILSVGFITGVMTVVFPPTAIAGLILIFGAFLLWVMPELESVPYQSLRKLFFVMVFVQISIPNYYAIETGYLPWISIRKVVALGVIILFGWVLAGSRSSKEHLFGTLKESRWLLFFMLGFLLMNFLSLFTAVSIFLSIKEFTDSLLNWYIPAFACCLVVRKEEDIVLLLKIVAVATIVNSMAGLIEFILERRYYFDLIPRGMLDSMLASNPYLATIYFGGSFRHGFYRANSIYSTSLSFSELAALATPIAFFFVAHGRNLREQILGVATGIWILVAFFCSGARGGILAALVAMPVMMVFWVARYSKLNPHSLWAPIVAVSGGLGIIGFFVLATVWRRLRNRVFGEGDNPIGSDDRFLQWQMALPHIEANPVSGHGLGSAGNLVGYHIESGLPTIDSYVISLLVEVGLPGFICFVGMIAVVVWTGLRLYIADRGGVGALAGTLACSFIAFAVYRLVLSQTENHTLVFILLGVMFVLFKLRTSSVSQAQV